MGERWHGKPEVSGSSPCPVKVFFSVKNKFNQFENGPLSLCPSPLPQALDAMHSLVRGLVAERRRNPTVGRPVFIDVLTESDLPEAQILDDCVTYIVDGFHASGYRTYTCVKIQSLFGNWANPYHVGDQSDGSKIVCAISESISGI